MLDSDDLNILQALVSKIRSMESVRRRALIETDCKVSLSLVVRYPIRSIENEIIDLPLSQEEINKLLNLGEPIYLKWEEQLKAMSQKICESKPS